MSWSILIIIICLLLAAFAVYREYQRPDKAHLGWRAIIVLVAVFALAGIILPISYTGTRSVGGTGKILLTAGFNADSMPENDSIYTLDKAIHQQYRKAKLLDNIQDLFSDSSNIAPVHFFGYGLDEEELKQLTGKPIIFHPSPIPDGFTAISWTEKPKTGEPFRVEGAYQNTSAKNYQLLLKGLNTTLDSVTVPARSHNTFTLKTVPKNSGRVIYNLTVLNGLDTLQQEQVPVNIEPALPLKVLLLSASPDFDTKFLKNWLGGNGYAVASRSSITKGKYGQEYINMDQPDLTHITTALLNKFDIIIGDLSVFKTFGRSEELALQQEISQKGLGVIIRADSSNKTKSWLQSSFPVSYLAAKQQTPTVLILQNNEKTARLNIDPLFIIPQNNTQPLITDDHNHLLAAMALGGEGKLVFTTINNSYTWALSGNQKDYAALWSLLIDKAARKLPVAGQWSVAPSIPMVNQPVQLLAESAVPLPGATIDQTIIYPAQNVNIPFRQQYTYWPKKYGWQQVVQPHSTNYWWFAWRKNGWLSLNIAKKESVNKQFFNSGYSPDVVTKQIQQKINEIVPKIYFYILFLMSLTFLWTESKFYSS